MFAVSSVTNTGEMKQVYVFDFGDDFGIAAYYYRTPGDAPVGPRLNLINLI